MRRADLPKSVIRLTEDTIETCFPVTGGAQTLARAQEHIDRFEVRIKRLGSVNTQRGNPRGHFGHMYWSPAAHHDHPAHSKCMGTVLFPTVWRTDDPCGEDDCRPNGDVIVPVTHCVPSRWPLPCIPVIDDLPAYGRVHGNEDVLLTYPVFRITPNEGLCVRWDRHLHELPVGRYAAYVYAENVLCGVFEMDKRYCCDVDLRSPKSKEITRLPELMPKPEGVTDMFDAAINWSSTTTCTMNPGDTLIGVADLGPFCTETFCKPPEVVIRDGVSQETLKVMGCQEGQLLVERTGTAKFQGGATIRFEWTANNVKCAAEGC